MKNQTRKELVGIIIDAINDERIEDTLGRDIHNEIFNTDYFIIGTHQAEQWLINNGGIFYAIEVIKDYELDNFGEVNTDLSDAEKVCNMYTYILSEEILQESNILRENWDNELTTELIEEFKLELENQL